MKRLWVFIIFMTLFYSSQSIHGVGSPPHFQISQLGIIQTEGELADLAWQPNGFLLATAAVTSEPGKINLWDIQTQELFSIFMLNITLQNPFLAWNLGGNKLAAAYADPQDKTSNNI
jgi:WD40 repeat protein